MVFQSLIYQIFILFYTQSKEVSAKIAEIEEPLFNELHSGIGDFKDAIDQFNDDFEKAGPMVEGITAKEASDRVTFIFLYSSTGSNLIFIHRHLCFKICSKNIGVNLTCTQRVKSSLVYPSPIIQFYINAKKNLIS